MQTRREREVRLSREEPKGWAVCDCCGLLTARRELLPWQRRVVCRTLASLEPFSRVAGRTGQAWPVGPFTCYYVVHEHQVCGACFDHLLDGGAFASPLRHRGKLAFLVLAAASAALGVILPQLLSW
jgi:hypothetical protein